MLKELQVRPHPEMQPAKYGCKHKKGSAKKTEPAITILIASSIIQTLLSVSELHRIGRRSGSRTLPPVGNYTRPRRFFIQTIS